MSLLTDLFAHANKISQELVDVRLKGEEFSDEMKVSWYRVNSEKVTF